VLLLVITHLLIVRFFSDYFLFVSVGSHHIVFILFEICDIDDVLYDISMFLYLFGLMSGISEWMINAYKALFIFNLFLIVILIIDLSSVW